MVRTTSKTLPRLARTAACLLAAASPAAAFGQAGGTGVAQGVVGQAVIDLSAGVWSTNNVTMTPGDQTGVGEGLQKQIWSVPRASDTKKFLRLRSVLTNN